MSEDLRHDLSPGANEPVDPVKMARRDLQKVLPRRFYKEVTVAPEEGAASVPVSMASRSARPPARSWPCRPARSPRPSPPSGAPRPS